MVKVTRSDKTTKSNVLRLPCRVRAKKRTGRCYELSGKGLLQAEDWTLVHGEVNAGSKLGNIRMDHAWLEKEGQVYDAVLDGLFEQDDYYRQCEVTEAKCYRSKEVILNISHFGHWGPWNN